MSQTPDLTDPPPHFPGTGGAPAIEYYRNVDATAAALLRTLGMVCVIVGGVEIGVELALALVSKTGFLFAGARYFFLLTDYFISLLLAIPLLVGGVLLLRRPLGGRKVLLVAAYGRLAYAACGLALSGWQVIMSLPSSIPNPYRYYGLLQAMSHGLSSSAMPLFLVMFLSQNGVRRLFDRDAIS